jgi:hypothetical protein
MQFELWQSLLGCRKRRFLIADHLSGHHALHVAAKSACFQNELSRVQ